MLSGIVKIAFFLITLGLLLFFFVSGYFTDLINGIGSLKESGSLFLGFFGTDPIFGIVLSLIAVIFVISIVLSFKPKG